MTENFINDEHCDTTECVIIGGADIVDYDRIKGYINDKSFIVCCDSGLKHIEKLSVMPDLVVGDFDSHDKPSFSVETIVLPREKDDTDTFFAVKEAVKRGFIAFTILGAVGNRLDHTLGNISILMYLNSLGLTARLIDDYSEMQVISDCIEISNSFSFFSTVSIDGTARGVCIENAKFPLHNAVIEPIYQYGISNEVLPGKASTRVRLKEGKLLIIKVF